MDDFGSIESRLTQTEVDSDLTDLEVSLANPDLFAGVVGARSLADVSSASRHDMQLYSACLPVARSAEPGGDCISILDQSPNFGLSQPNMLSDSMHPQMVDGDIDFQFLFSQPSLWEGQVQSIDDVLNIANGPSDFDMWQGQTLSLDHYDQGQATLQSHVFVGSVEAPQDLLDTRLSTDSALFDVRAPAPNQFLASDSVFLQSPFLVQHSNPIDLSSGLLLQSIGQPDPGGTSDALCSFDFPTVDDVSIANVYSPQPRNSLLHSALNSPTVSRRSPSVASTKPLSPDDLAHDNSRFAKVVKAFLSIEDINKRTVPEIAKRVNTMYAGQYSDFEAVKRMVNDVLQKHRAFWHPGRGSPYQLNLAEGRARREFPSNARHRKTTYSHKKFSNHYHK